MGRYRIEPNSGTSHTPPTPNLTTVGVHTEAHLGCCVFRLHPQLGDFLGTSMLPSATLPPPESISCQIPQHTMTESPALAVDSYDKTPKVQCNLPTLGTSNPHSRLV